MISLCRTICKAVCLISTNNQTSQWKITVYTPTAEPQQALIENLLRQVVDEFQTVLITNFAQRDESLPKYMFDKEYAFFGLSS